MFQKSNQASYNQRGFSLVEILVGVAMLGGLSIAVMNMTKQQAKLSTKSLIDGDITEISARILNALNSPKYCQDNFNTTKATGNNIAISPIYVIGKTITAQPPATAWDMNSAANITSRVRMNSATYSVTDATPVSGNPRSLAILNLRVVFETKALELEKKNITKDFTATVVVNGSSIIQGCPKTWNSTVLFGE